MKINIWGISEKNIIFSSPPSGDVTTWPPLLSGRQIMKSRFANYFLVKAWSMSLHLLPHLPSSPVSQSDPPLYNRLRDLDTAKNNNNTDFLEETSLRARGKKQKETVSDRARKWFLSAHNKGHIFCSLSYLDRSPESTVFVICGDELTKVRLCLVLFQLS